MPVLSSNKRPDLISLTTINPDGSRYVLHPADVKGPFTSARRLFGLLLIAIYVLLPWIPINGAPALFLDVENRRFHMFGITLLTQDMWVFFFAVSGLGFALFFVTSLLGVATTRLVGLIHLLLGQTICPARLYSG